MVTVIRSLEIGFIIAFYRYLLCVGLIIIIEYWAHLFEVTIAFINKRYLPEHSCAMPVVLI